MQVICSREQLNRGLNIAGRAVSTRTTLPVLGNVLLATDEDRLRLSATNLDVSITCWLPCHSVARQGAITIPFRLLSGFVSSLPNEDITLDVNEINQTVQVACARYEATIHGIKADEFPTLPVVDGSPLAQLPAGLLREMITQVSQAASGDDNRPVLSGVLLRFNGAAGAPQLTMAAADGFRLAVRHATLAEPINATGEPRIIVPARALNELARVLPDAGAMEDTPIRITITPNGNQVLFTAPNLQMTARLVEGNFPNYEQIIPSAWQTRATMTTGELLKAVRIASYFAKDSAGVIRLALEAAEDGDAGQLTVSAQAAEMGSNQTRLDALIEGASGQIAFNAKYVLDVLSVIETPTVALEMQGPAAPGVIKPVIPSQNYLCIVMPMHVTPAVGQ